MKKAILIISMLFFALSGFSQVTNTVSKEVKEKIIINSEITQKVLTEFVDGAEYYNVNYIPILQKIKSIKVVNGTNDWITRSIDGDIYLNDRLLLYPNLMRLHILREIGLVGGLKGPEKDIRYIMWDGWELNPRFEFYADSLRSRGVQRQKYFEQWQRLHPVAWKV